MVPGVAWRRVPGLALAALRVFRRPKMRFLCCLPQCNANVGVVAHGKFLYVHNKDLCAVEVFAEDGTWIKAWSIPARWNRKYLKLRATRNARGLDLVILFDHVGFGVYTTDGVLYSETKMPADSVYGSFVVCGDQIVVLQWYKTMLTFALTGEMLHQQFDAPSPWSKLCSHQSEILASRGADVVALKQGTSQPHSQWKLPMATQDWTQTDENFHTQCLATDGHVVFANTRAESRKRPSMVNVLRKTDGRLLAVWHPRVGAQALVVSSAGHRLVCCPDGPQCCVVYALE